MFLGVCADRHIRTPELFFAENCSECLALELTPTEIDTHVKELPERSHFPCHRRRVCLIIRDFMRLMKCSPFRSVHSHGQHPARVFTARQPKTGFMTGTAMEQHTYRQW